MAAQTYTGLITGIPGLTHYYTFNDVDKARDLKGNINGIIHGAPKFTASGMVLDGNDWIELPDHADFSPATTKELTIVIYQTVNDWTKVSHNNEYIHWMGKGRSGQYEWTFRIYKDGGGGEAPARKRRTSFYSYNPSGGLGAGSFFQDEGDGPGVERIVGGQISAKGTGSYPGWTKMWKNGVVRDTDSLSGYSIIPKRTPAPVGIGTRGDNTGFLVGTIRRVAFFNRALTAAEMKTLADSKSLPDGQISQPDGGGAVIPTPPTPVAGKSRIRIGTAERIVDGVDINRGADQLIVYTSATGGKTTTNGYGTEAAVRGSKIVSHVQQAGGLNASIPSDGFVLSGHGTSRTWLDTNAKIGASAELI